jgi:hypothetical protein
MEGALRTAILIDGSDDAIALRIQESEKRPYIAQGRAGKTARNFKFVRSVEVKAKGDEEPRVAYVYRLVGGDISDADFEALAAAEVDKHLRPEKYAKLTSKPLSTDERAELEAYRRRYGAGK